MGTKREFCPKGGLLHAWVYVPEIQGCNSIGTQADMAGRYAFVAPRTRPGER